MTGIELYNAAKEAYYNDTQIMSDYEFDELEASLGLENKSYVGTRHNPSYTVEHPIIMGSLSKVQIKEAEDGSIDWTSYWEDVKSYINHTHCFDDRKEFPLVVTPKYDGCSFEVVVNNDENIFTISSRGDGSFGKDLRSHLTSKVMASVEHISAYFSEAPIILRGEVLIDKQKFENKYSQFVNPRSFVSGVLNRDYDKNDTEFINMLNDLSVVIYDVRVKVDDTWTDIDWWFINYDTKPSFFNIGMFNDSANDFAEIYKLYSDYRQKCEFALDGFVIKPQEAYRLNNTTEHRPKDCVAVKFIPMLQETVVEEIIWSTRKTNEMIPVVKVKPVIMDGKVVTKASGHNYGYLIDNNISVGTKVILSLAGDIIPFIYKVTDASAFSELEMNLPTEEYNGQYHINGCHLLKMLSKEELTRKKFINSCIALNLPGLGGSGAEKIYDYVVESCKGDDFLGIESKEVPNNILYINSDEIHSALGGKTGISVAKEFNKLIANITLKDIINSMSIESCGSKVIEQIENHFLYDNADFTHLNKDAYNWIYDTDSSEYIELLNIMHSINRSFDGLKADKTIKDSSNADQIPVILTGEPNNYKSKNDFLAHHPEYRVTGSWKEVKIVFTNSLESNTGKMKNARAKGIEIQLY